VGVNGGEELEGRLAGRLQRGERLGEAVEVDVFEVELAHPAGVGGLREGS
jgi:hypothetical protein